MTDLELLKQYGEERPRAMVDRDLPCIRCGYNLRTLASDRRCPECAMPVGLTTSLGGPFTQTRPAYVRRLARGCWLLLAARCAIFTGFLWQSVNVTSDNVANTLVLCACAALASLLCFIGTWFFTIREHPKLPPEMPRTTLGMRILSFAGVVLLAPWVVYEFMDAWSRIYRTASVWPSRYSHLLPVMCWLAVVLYCLYPLLEMRLMVRLSRRLANAALGHRMLVTGIGATVSSIMAIIGFALIVAEWQESPTLAFRPVNRVIILMNYYRDPSAPVGHAAGLCFGFAIALVLLFWTWAAFNCSIAARSFSRAAREATWRWEDEMGM